MRLYEIADEYRRIAGLIDDAAGELSPELEADLDSVSASLADKAESIAALVREADAEADAYAAEMARLAARKKAAEGRADRLKAYLLAAMEAASVPKIKGPLWTVSARQASRPVIRWEGSGEVPERFAVLVRQVDAKAAYEAYKDKTLPYGFTAKVTQYLEIR